MDKLAMAHDYVVACLRSGKKLDDINLDVAYKMAIDLEKIHKSSEDKSRPDVLEDLK